MITIYFRDLWGVKKKPTYHGGSPPGVIFLASTHEAHRSQRRNSKAVVDLNPGYPQVKESLLKVYLFGGINIVNPV